MQRRIPLQPIHRIDLDPLLIQQRIQHVVAAVSSRDVQAIVANAVGGGVEEVGDFFGGGDGCEDFVEEGGVVAAAGLEEEFAGGGALDGGVSLRQQTVGGIF